MNIDELTIREIREIQHLFKVPENQHNHPYQVGEKYFIRTVTHHFTGRLKVVFDGEIVLTECAWIADDGAFSESLVSGDHNEVEPYPENTEVIIPRGGIIDASVYSPKLPLSRK